MRRRSARWDRHTFVDPARTQGQTGSVLLMVLGVVLFLSITVVGILSMTSATRATGHRLELDTRTLHRIDGALEQAVNKVRDERVCGTETFGAYTVICSLESDPADMTKRVMSFEAADAVGGGDPVALARVKVTDEVNGIEVVGHSVEVCDWLLGRKLHSDALKGCSA